MDYKTTAIMRTEIIEDALNAWTNGDSDSTNPTIEEINEKSSKVYIQRTRLEPQTLADILKDMDEPYIVLEEPYIGSDGEYPFFLYKSKDYKERLEADIVPKTILDLISE